MPSHFSVGFVDDSLKREFARLEQGPFQEKRVADFLHQAIVNLAENPYLGIPIPRKLWPKIYMTKYRIDNLRKYDLPMGWRLIYTLRGTEVEVISILIEWFDHKHYERRFGYG